MIEINIIRENDEVRAIIATGHASKGEKSEQICSGVSTLMYTLALSLREYRKVGISVIDDEVGMCVEVIRGYHKKDVQVILSTIIRGLKGIADLYPHSVKIRWN